MTGFDPSDFNYLGICELEIPPFGDDPFSLKGLDKMPILSATTVRKVGLSSQGKSMLVLTKYVVKLYISRNKGNLAGLDLGKQLEKNDKMNSSIVFLPGLWQSTNQEPGWCLFNLLGLWIFIPCEIASIFTFQLV